MTTPEGTDFTMRSKGGGHFPSGFRDPARRAVRAAGRRGDPGPSGGCNRGVIVNPYIADQIGQITEPCGWRCRGKDHRH